MVNVTDDRIDVLKSFYVKRDELTRRLEFWQLNADRIELELGLCVKVRFVGYDSYTGQEEQEERTLTLYDYQHNLTNILNQWTAAHFGFWNIVDTKVEIIEKHEQTAHHCPHCFNVMPIDETCKNEHCIILESIDKTGEVPEW